ncbi:MAG: cytochrome P450 [Chloroflexi bacterium]|nr:cytochrome P450 [Chloroflexota bacterium]
MSQADAMDPASGLPSGVQLTPLDAKFQHDPHPVLDKLRERAAVHHDDVFHRWFLTRHDDIETLLKDRSLSVDPRKAADGTYMRLFGDIEGDREPSMLFQDAPTHTRLRGLVNKAFTPRAVEEMRPRIGEIVDELLDAVDGKEGFDLIAAFAGPLPTIVIAEMLGVDPEDRADFKRWSDEGVKAFNPLLTDEERGRVMAAGEAMEAYLRTTIAERKDARRDDLISSLVAVEEGGETLSTDEVATMCGLLLAAGNVTTTDLIGNGVLALLQHPQELRKLRDDPSLIENAVEEMLRYDSPVTQTGRIATSDVTLDGCPISQGQSIVTSLAAANHDPSVYPEPHTFDITRKDTHHQSFGGGSHYCLGAPVARLEAQIGVDTLVRRFPNLRLADEPLEYRRIPVFRGLVRLPVLI